MLAVAGVREAEQEQTSEVIERRISARELEEKYRDLHGSFTVTTYRSALCGKSRESIALMLDEHPDLHPQVSRDGGKSSHPFYEDPASREIIDRIFKARGVFPLMYFRDPSQSPTGTKLVLAVRPHKPTNAAVRGDAGIRRLANNFAELRNSEIIARDVADSIQPISDALGRDPCFQMEDVGLMFLPNDDSDVMRSLISDPRKRKEFLNIVDGRVHGQGLLNYILVQAVQDNASDIAFDALGVNSAGQEHYLLRIKVDGRWRKLPLMLDGDAFKRCINALETLAKETSTEQGYDPRGKFDGGVTFSTLPPDKNKFSDAPDTLRLDRNIPAGSQMFWNEALKRIFVRIARVPTGTQKPALTVRVQYPPALTSIDKLDFTPRQKATIISNMEEPDGLVLNTGPTGSGKTTTLAACINQVNTEDRLIVTAEDPIEVQLPGVRQMLLTRDKFEFAEANRMFLRQAPDIILIGEMRDSETAMTGVKAASTGHLVVSTLHTRDAVGVVARLESLNVEKFLISDSLRLVMSQRLIPTINPANLRDGVATADLFDQEDILPELCRMLKYNFVREKLKRDAVAGTVAGASSNGVEAGSGGEFAEQETPPDLADAIKILLAVPKDPDAVDIPNYKPYAGRTPILEIMTVNQEMREMIYNGAHAKEIVVSAMKDPDSPYVPMELHGLLKVFKGQTSLSALCRVIGKTWALKPHTREAAIDMINRYLDSNNATTDDEILYPPRPADDLSMAA